MNAISRELAEKEIERWLNAKRVKPPKRERLKGQIDLLIEEIEAGALIVTEDGTLKQNLTYGIGADGSVKELTYKNRITVRDVHKQLQGVKADDADGRMIAYASALTDVPRAQLGGLDSEDYAIPQAIALFFI